MHIDAPSNPDINPKTKTASAWSSTKYPMFVKKEKKKTWMVRHVIKGKTNAALLEKSWVIVE